MTSPKRQPEKTGYAIKGLVQILLAQLRDKMDVVLSLGVRGGAVIAGFAVTYLIGSSLGPAATGQYALVSQTALFLSVVALLGLNISVVRHFSKAIAQGKKLALRSFGKITAIGMALMALLVLILWLGADVLWPAFFDDVAPQAMLAVLCILLVARGGVQLLGGMLRSQHSFVVGQAIAVLAIPAITAIALASGIVTTVHGALWASAYAGLAALAFGALFMLRHTDRTWGGSVDISTRTVVASSLPLWGVGIAQNIGDWYSLAVAAQMLSAADAGLYRVGVQIAMALQVIANAIFSVYSAKISAAFHAEDRSKAAKLARTAVRVSTALAVPSAVVLILSADLILQQFGPDFRAAWPVLLCLVIGQLIFTLTGPAGLVLAMSGNERVNLIITIAGMSAVLVLVPIGAIYGGLVGIAVAVTAALIARNLTAYIFVRRREGIDIWSGRILPGFSEKSTG
ncbi:MAG: oligosaccharide flippase family protein [Erythrobacter sp.]